MRLGIKKIQFIKVKLRKNLLDSYLNPDFLVLTSRAYVYALWFSTYVKEQYCISNRRQENLQNGCMSSGIGLLSRPFRFYPFH